MRLVNYFKNSYNELVHKVTWPTLAQLQNSAFVVMVASIIFGLVVFGIDKVFENIMSFVYSLFY